MVGAGIKLSEDGGMLILLLGLHKGLVVVGSMLLIQEKLEVKVLVHGCQDPEDRWLGEIERHNVALIVPEMVDSEAGPVVEVLLLPIEAREIPRGVEGGRQLFVRASEYAVQRGGCLARRVDLRGLHVQLVVGAPVELAALRTLLEEPKSEIGLGAELEDALHLVVSLLTPDQAKASTRRPKASLDLLFSSF